MAVVKIYKYPHIILREMCKPIESIEASTRQLIDDMTSTMYDCNGAVGLAAPQVGHPVRMVLIDVTAKTTQSELRVMINPEITKQSRNKLVREGCLSFPDYLANTKRGTRVTVRYMDEHGKTIEAEVRDLEAIAVQHELDHLDGVLMIDRVNSLKTDLIRRYSALGSEAPSK